MNIADIKGTQAIYVCLHVFENSRKIALFGREPDGPLVATCGCEVDEAHVIGFGHLRERLATILQLEVPTKGRALQFDTTTQKWQDIS